MEPYSVDAWLAFGKLIADASWPIAVVTIAIVFREDIAAALPRIRRVAGLELDPPKINQPSASRAPLQEGTDQIPPGVSPAVIAEGRAEILHILDGVPPADQTNRLIQLLALSRRGVAYLWIARSIFGSQLDLLSRTIATGALTTPFVDSAYQLHVARANLSPETTPPLTKAVWLSYLTTNGLLTSTDEAVFITERGRDFHSFVATILGDTPLSRAL